MASWVWGKSKFWWACFCFAFALVTAISFLKVWAWSFATVVLNLWYVSHYWFMRAFLTVCRTDARNCGAKLENCWWPPPPPETPCGVAIGRPERKYVKLHTVAASNNRGHAPQLLYYCFFAPHIYMGVILRAHLVRGESHIQRNANREVATAASKWFFKFPCSRVTT